MRIPWKKGLVGVFLSSTFTATSFGQNCTATCPGGSGSIKVWAEELGGSTVTQLDCRAAGTDFSIDISSLSIYSVTGDVVLHIFDCGGGNNIGQVTISGSSTSLSSLAVLVAGPTWVWTDNSSTEILSNGCVNFGGLIVSDTSTGGTESKTRASIACSGSITQVSTSSPPAPDVIVNQVVRIQAGERIDGKVTAKVTGSTYGFTANAIGAVRAQAAIRGEVKADDKDIFEVRVLRNASGVEGITGDIKAEQGKISAISSTGPIGSTSYTPQIRAKNGILQMACGYTEGGSSVAAADLRANVTADVTPTGQTPAGNIERIRSTAKVLGTVHALNIGYTGGGPSTSDTAGTLFGIYADGEIGANITTLDSLLYGQIRGSTITGTVRIGFNLAGSVVATDATNGKIHSLTVGRDTTSTSAGFIGGYRAPTWDPSPTGCLAAEFQLGPISLISAARIEYLDIYRVDTVNYFPPEIASPRIDILRLDYFIHALLWSGRRTGTPTYAGPLRSDVKSYSDTKDAEMIETRCKILASLGSCSNPPAYFEAAIYLGSFDKFDILNKHNTSTYLWQLAPTETFRVGCTFGDNAGNLCHPFNIYNDAELKGQVVFYAYATAVNAPPCGSSTVPAATPWQDKVEIGSVPIILAPSGLAGTSDDVAPYYLRPSFNSTTPSASIGGGAVGQAPYHLYRSDSTPPGGSASSPALISQYAISTRPGGSPVPMTPAFYGPLVHTTNAGRIEVCNDTSDACDPDDPSSWSDASFMFDRVAAPTNGNPREVRITVRTVGYPAQSLPVPRGRYRFVQGSGDSLHATVRCASTFASTAPPVADFAYYFCVLRDCPSGSTPPDGTPETTCGDYVGCGSTIPDGPCVADCDDGSETGTPDGGVGIEDLLYFMSLYDAGVIEADVDDGSSEGIPDGGVGIEDLLYFLYRYDIGC
jgi:hypothetical protein